MILYNDDLGEVVTRNEAESTFGNVDTRRIKRNASLHNTFATSECTLTPIESIDASCLWYDVEEGRYIKEPALGLRSSALVGYNADGHDGVEVRLWTEAMKQMEWEGQSR